MDELPKFDVEFDVTARLLRWTMRGFWTMADVAAFARALSRAVAPLGAPPYRFDRLCDSRTLPVQAVEISNALGEIERAGATHAGRIAIVVGTMINKIQAQRTLVTGDVKVFLSMEDAEAWLAQGKEPQ